MSTVHNKATKNEMFETMAVPEALATMAIPTIVSQLITLIYMHIAQLPLSPNNQFSHI